MSVQTVLVALCVLAALAFLLRPWFRKLSQSSHANQDASSAAGQPACGACRGCSSQRSSGGCH